MKSTGRFTPALKKLVHYSYNQCSECTGPLAKGVAAYAGYTTTGEEIYVGECCQAKISELASHIYCWWETYRRPTPDTVLWRYMDFAKLLALLGDGALHFARSDHLGDPFEGARGIALREQEWKTYCLEYFRKAVRTAPGQTDQLSAERVEEEAERLYLDFAALGERELRNTFVTCWHANEGESEALWRLYCPPPITGIAIRTEFGLLDRALDDTRFIKFGYVQYTNFAEAFAGTYDRIFWKRASLSHETEVRGVITKEWQNDADEYGLLVPVDLSLVITAIVTSPFAPRWFDAVVREVMQKFGVDAPVQSSSLLAEPFF